MSYFAEGGLGGPFRASDSLKAQFGFVPNLFRAQISLPVVVEAEAGLLSRILFDEHALSRVQKELVLLMVAAAHGCAPCAALAYEMLRLLAVPESRLEQITSNYQDANLSPVNKALVSFALKLGTSRSTICREDITSLIAHGLTDEFVLELILTTALTNFLCTLSKATGVEADFAAKQLPAGAILSANGNSTKTVPRPSAPFVRAPQPGQDDFAPFALLREQFDFVPALFRAQTLRPDVLEAEAELIGAVFRSDRVLTEVQKKSILTGGRPALCSEADEALFDCVAKLAQQPSAFSGEDIDLLRRHRFTDEKILEGLVTISLTDFLSTVQFGLGSALDFPLCEFQGSQPKILHLSMSDHRHTDVTLFEDPDAEAVARVQGGDLEGFEDLMKRHSQRVYRTLIGFLGSPEEAQDAMQDTFLKAFQHLGGFEGRSKFSTWLLTIASNTGIQRLRERRHFESLDQSEVDSEDGFRPRQIQAWTEDPEQLYSQSEMRSLIEGGVMKLPAKYRVVLMLRDIEQLSVEEAAAALGLGIPAFKARLLRGRLMLREAMAPHFTAAASKGSAKGVTS